MASGFQAFSLRSVMDFAVGRVALYGMSSRRSEPYWFSGSSLISLRWGC